MRQGKKYNWCDPVWSSQWASCHTPHQSMYTHMQNHGSPDVTQSQHTTATAPAEELMLTPHSHWPCPPYQNTAVPFASVMRVIWQFMVAKYGILQPGLYFSDNIYERRQQDCIPQFHIFKINVQWMNWKGKNALKTGYILKCSRIILETVKSFTTLPLFSLQTATIF